MNALPCRPVARDPLDRLLPPPRPAPDAAAPAFPIPGPATRTRTKILLVEDHPITRQGLKILIQQQPDLEVCGETDNAPHALELFAGLRPHLAIVDLTLKTSNGLELTKNLKALAPDFPVLMVSMHDEDAYAERAIRAGAMGYVMKQEASEKIIAAIRSLLLGRVFVSEKIAGRMLRRFANTEESVAAVSSDTLTDREMEVLLLIGDGYGTRQIAQMLNLSVKTINSHRENLKAKLNLQSGVELVRHAIHLGRSQQGVAEQGES